MGIIQQQPSHPTTTTQLPKLYSSTSNLKSTSSKCSSPPSPLSSPPLALPLLLLSSLARTPHPALSPLRVTTSGRSPNSTDASRKEPTTTASASTSRPPTEEPSTSPALLRPISLRTTSGTPVARTASWTSLSTATAAVCS